MASQEYERILNKIYYDTSNSHAFASESKLWQHVKSKNLNITKKQFNQWKASQSVFTSYRAARKKFKKIRIRTAGINDLWDGDLMQMTSFAKDNQGISYILIAIDVFSRYLRIKKMKSKSAKDSLLAIRQLFEEVDELPTTFRTDNGMYTVFHFHCATILYKCEKCMQPCENKCL